jgi:hypothetical protein
MLIHYISIRDGRYNNSEWAHTAEEALERATHQAPYPASHYSIITEAHWNAERERARALKVPFIIGTF